MLLWEWAVVPRRNGPTLDICDGVTRFEPSVLFPEGTTLLTAWLLKRAIKNLDRLTTKSNRT